MEPLKIALNIRYVKLDKLDGIGLYSYELTKRLIERNPQHQFTLISDGSPLPELTKYENTQWVKLFPPSRFPALLKMWLQALGKYLERNQPDILVSFGGTTPPKGNYKTKIISVIHDLNFIVNPLWAPGKWALAHKENTLESLSRAHKLITVSNFSKKEIVRFFSVEPNKIAVINNASRFNREPKKIKQPLILWVGSISARKNIENLLKAFIIFKNNHADAPDLLLVGRFYQGGKKVIEPYEDAIEQGHIRVAGRLNDQELSALMQQATFLVNPSFYEGFGLPLVEAMSCGLPVVCSDIEVFKEVCEKAALYFNPNSVESIAEALGLMWLNPDLRQKLSIEGLTQSTKYSWYKSANELMEVIEETHKS